MPQPMPQQSIEEPSGRSQHLNLILGLKGPSQAEVEATLPETYSLHQESLCHKRHAVLRTASA